MRIVPYMMFHGNCEEALHFYESVFGGKAVIMRYSDAEGMPYPEGWGDKVLHAQLDIEGCPLYFSDSPVPISVGSLNPGLTLEPDSEAQQTRWFNGLAEGGKINMPLEDTFWGARYGQVHDRFGFNWSLNFQKTPL